MRKFACIVAGILLLGITVGCAPPSYRAHPEIEQRLKEIKSPGLITPDIKIYELSAGGVHELKDEWCAQGKDNTVKAFSECFKDKKEIKTLTVAKEMEDEMEDIQALYRAVSTSINSHTYSPLFEFPDKKKNFVYSIGPIHEILKKYEVDAMLFVYGVDEISTGGRKTLQAAGILLGAVTGVMIIPRSGITVMSAALVDSSGTILWYNIKGSQGGYDLRETDSTKKMVQNILDDLPSIGK